jgi:hypothetical protein
MKCGTKNSAALPRLKAALAYDICERGEMVGGDPILLKHLISYEMRRQNVAVLLQRGSGAKRASATRFASGPTFSNAPHTALSTFIES